MSDMTHYPPASEAVDAALFSALGTLQTTSAEGFRRIEDRMGEMVTKGEFVATVSRLQDVDAANAARIDTANNRIVEVNGRIAAGFAEAHEERKEKDTKSRWFIGILFTAVALVSPLVTHYVTLLLNARP